MDEHPWEIARELIRLHHAKFNQATTLVGERDPNVRLQMTEREYGIWVEGVAVLEAQQVTFELGLNFPTKYTDCVDGTDGVQGLNLLATSNDVDLSLQLRHAFFDSLAYGEENLQFQPIADADSNEDNIIEAWELERVSVDELGYNLEGRVSDSLDQFVSLSIAQGFRVNNNGLCTIWAI